jgi:peptide subunit release factor RF-3
MPKAGDIVQMENHGEQKMGDQLQQIFWRSSS